MYKIQKVLKYLKCNLFRKLKSKFSTHRKQQYKNYIHIIDGALHLLFQLYALISIKRMTFELIIAAHCFGPYILRHVNGHNAAE